MINFRRLKDIREDNDITQMQMAHILGVNRSTYSQWEIGVAVIPIHYLYNFASHFYLTIDYCLGLTDKREKVYYEKFNLSSIGCSLKQLRIEKHLSQKELASILHISQPCIARYEKGDISMSISNLYKYAKYFKVTLDKIIRIKTSIQI